MKSTMTDQELIAAAGIDPEFAPHTARETLVAMRAIADAAVRKAAKQKPARPDYETMLRDEFAGRAITGTLPGAAVGDERIKEYAEWAYKMADAMMEARNANR